MVESAKYVRKCFRITSPPCHNGQVASYPSRAFVRLVLVVAATVSTSLPSTPVTPLSAQPARIAANGQGTLLFIGDSLTVGANAFGSLPTRVRAMTTWPRLSMDARVGRTASAGAAIIKKKLTKDTTAIVVALGTNDMISKSETWYPTWVIDKLMVQARGRPVLWMNVEFSATSRREWRSRAARFNRALVSATQRWPNLSIADWNAHFRPNRVSRFIADGVHLTVNGYRTRATFALRQMTEFGARIISATTTTTTIPTTSSELQTTIPATTDPTTTVPTTTSPTTSTPPSSPPTT